MPIETLAPDAIISSTNLSGAVADIQDAIPSWTPEDISPTLWLEADGTGTLRDSGGSTAGALQTVYAGKTPPVYLEQWDDASGNGHHFVQATQANQGEYTGSVLDGYGGLVTAHPSVAALSGPNRASLYTGQNFTIAAALRFSAVNTAGIADEGRDAVISDGWSGMLARHDGVGGRFIYAYAYDGSYRTPELPISLDTDYVAIIRASGGSIQIALNGGTPESVSLPGNIGGADTTVICHRTSTHLGALIVVASDIGATEEVNLLAYLAAKAGITI